MIDYITNKDTIIFSPYYDELIDTTLLSQYNKIIFSNYELNDNLFDAYENLDFKNLKFSASKFNQKVELHPKGCSKNSTKGCCSCCPKNLTFGLYFNQKVDLPKNLTHLTFGFCFNQKVDLPENLTHLTFGWDFNQEVELPKNLTHLTFDVYSKFNQEVELPKNLTHLTFGQNFNQKVELPTNLTHLKLFNDKAHNLDYLPEGIEELELGKYFNDDTLCNLPNSLKVIKLYKNCKCNLKCLPTNTKIKYYE
jgi:hypothetical protein